MSNELWTREALEAAFPLGEVTIQIDEETRPMNEQEREELFDRLEGKRRSYE